MNRATRKAKKPNVSIQETVDFQPQEYQFTPIQPLQPAPQVYDPAQFAQYAPQYQPNYVQGNFQNQQFVPQPMSPQPPQQNGMFYGGGPADQSGFQIPSQLLQPAAASMAMQFGEALVGQGKQAFDRELGRYFSVERLKYYFAVDTNYVAKKLAILTLPFTHTVSHIKRIWTKFNVVAGPSYAVLLKRQGVKSVTSEQTGPLGMFGMTPDWSLKYSSDEPIQPRLDVNAPDLYIPLMGYVTFILMSGIVQGLQDKFTPEALGIEASSKLAWLTVEVLIVLLTLYVMNLPTTLKTFDVIAFCGYKYVGMIGILLASLLFSSMGYTAAWIFYSASFMFFLVRSLKVQVQPHGGQPDVGFKRTTYLLLFMSGIQPVLMWWLTRHLALTPVPSAAV